MSAYIDESEAFIKHRIYKEAFRTAREQLTYISWRHAIAVSERALLPAALREFQQSGPTKHPTMWNEWVVYRATRKLLGKGQ